MSRETPVQFCEEGSKTRAVISDATTVFNTKASHLVQKRGRPVDGSGLDDGEGDVVGACRNSSKGERRSSSDEGDGGGGEEGREHVDLTRTEKKKKRGQHWRREGEMQR